MANVFRTQGRTLAPLDFMPIQQAQDEGGGAGVGQSEEAMVAILEHAIHAAEVKKKVESGESSVEG